MSYDETAAKLFLEARWREKAGLDTTAYSFDRREDLDSLRRTEVSKRFRDLMTAGKIMGRFRYGLFKAEDKAVWDRLSRIEKEVALYRQDGNDERLVDIANMAELEFEEGRHPNKHFMAQDDKTHTKETR